MPELSLRCPECGVAVEDEGLCIQCYDSRIDAQGYAAEMSEAIGLRAQDIRRQRRYAEMLEAYRQGASVAVLAARYNCSQRAIHRGLARGRQLEKGRVTA